ncbi:flagellar hook-length control protein FliK [Maridesulfovibrio frigidus]|uniref:flagellar hook-length control protein FliK n=1 Tax=Maridesulfovibrio frigidus TaxID=340956 RepID=UPI0004E18ABA|nr:flagellar hook-length control protein FliK [Maridesulfovibrio frigidus]
MQILPHLDQSTNELAKITDRSNLVEDSYRSSMFDDFLYSSKEAGLESVYQPVQEAVADIRSTYDEAPSESVQYDDEVRSTSEYIEEAAREVANQSVDQQPQDIKVSREDWNEIKEELEEYGVDKKDIVDLEEKVMSEGGLSYGELVSELTGMMTSVKGFTLNPVQEQNMHSLFSKLGFTPDESKGMLTKISQGKMGEVVEQVQAKIASLPDSQPLQLSEDETKTLSEFFKLSGEKTSQLAKMVMTEGSTVGSVKKGFSMLEDVLTENTAVQDAKDLDLVKTVSNSLQNSIDKASDQTPDNFRMASAKVIRDSMGVGKDISEKNNPTAGEGEPENSHSVMTGKDTVGVASSSTTNHSGANSEAKSANNLDGKSDKSSTAGNQKGAFEGNAQDKNTFGSSTNGDSQTNQDGNNSASGDTKYTAKHWLENILTDSKDVDTWNDFFGKLTDGSTIKGESALLGEGLGSSSMGALKGAATAAQAGKTSGMWANTARSNVLEQVQEGAFKNLGQGTKQLTLTLNPLELGTVNVMIQVKNKEVQATIRAESPETAKVIAEQLEAVKQVLEEQGLKVEKLEVQTGLADSETQDSWNGAQDHNSAHYQEMMAGMKKRWQALRQEGTSLAQDMQNIEHAATISQSGLHVVA